MSDRDVRDEDLTLDGDVALLCAVLDELALDKVSLVGGSSGGCAAIAFSARFPERVDRLLLYGAYADGSDDHFARGARIDRRNRALPLGIWGRGCWPTSSWATPTVPNRSELARYQREATSPETAAVLLELTYRNNVRSRVGSGTCAHAGRTSPGRSRDPVSARPRARGRDPDRDADPARRKRPLSVGRRLAVGGARVAFGARARKRRPARPADPPAVLLSGREREVLALVAQGLSDQEIARTVGLEPTHGAPPRREHPPQARAYDPHGGGRRGRAARSALTPITRTGHLGRMADGGDAPAGAPSRMIALVKIDIRDTTPLTEFDRLGAHVRGRLRPLLVGRRAGRSARAPKGARSAGRADSPWRSAAAPASTCPTTPTTSTSSSWPNRTARCMPASSSV